MANAVEKSCTMLVYNDKQSSFNEIKEALEGNDVEAKVEAMQKAVTMLLNGEQLPQLFITIVRYVLPSEDHTVQKLLLLYLVRAQLGRVVLEASSSYNPQPTRQYSTCKQKPSSCCTPAQSSWLYVAGQFCEPGDARSAAEGASHHWMHKWLQAFCLALTCTCAHHQWHH